tara:strand:- start:171 stop:944 length:774 start_codon:yes stop_codon:yes gene_type:complete
MIAPRGASKRAPPEALDAHLLVLRMLEVSHAQRHEKATQLQREWRRSLQRRAARDEQLRKERVARARQGNKQYLAGLERAGMEVVPKPPPVPMPTGWPPGTGPDLASPTSVFVDWEQWPPPAPPPPPLPAGGTGPSKLIVKPAIETPPAIETTPAIETPRRKKPPPGRPPWTQHVLSEPATHVPLPLAQRGKRRPGGQLRAACRVARRSGSRVLAGFGAVRQRSWWQRSSSTPTVTARWEQDAAKWEYDARDAALAT